MNKFLLITFLITIVIVMIFCSNKGGEENIFVQPINTIKNKDGDQLDYDKLKLVWAEFNVGTMVNTDNWTYEIINYLERGDSGDWLTPSLSI